MDELRGLLAGTALDVVEEVVITPKVVRALDLDDARKRSLVNRLTPGFLHRTALDFAAAKDSETLATFVNGKHEYFSFILRKDPSPSHTLDMYQTPARLAHPSRAAS